MPPPSRPSQSHTLEQPNKRLVWKPVLSTPFSTKWPELSEELSNDFLDQLVQLLHHPHFSDPHLIPTQPDQSRLTGMNIAEYRNHLWSQKRGRNPLTRSENQPSHQHSTTASSGLSCQPHNKAHSQNDKKPNISHSIRPVASSNSIMDVTMHQDSVVRSTAIPADKEHSDLGQAVHATCDVKMNAEEPAPIDACAPDPNDSQNPSINRVLTLQDVIMDGPIGSPQGLPQSGDIGPTSPHPVKEILQPIHVVTSPTDKVVAMPGSVSHERYKPADARAGGVKRKRPLLSNQRPALLDYAVIGINAVTKQLESEIAQGTRLNLSDKSGSSKSKLLKSRLTRASTKAPKSDVESNRPTMVKGAQADDGQAQSVLEPAKKPTQLIKAISEISDTLLDTRLPTDSMSFQCADVSGIQTHQHNRRNRLPYQASKTCKSDDPSDRIRATLFTHVRDPDFSKDELHSDLLAQSAVCESSRSIFNHLTPKVVEQNNIRPRELRQLGVKQILKSTELKDSVRYIKPRTPAAQASYAPAHRKPKGQKSATGIHAPAPGTQKSTAQTPVDPPAAPKAKSPIPNREPVSEKATSKLGLIFVCKDDLNPTSLVDHLLPTIATLNHHRACKKRLKSAGEESSDESLVYVVPLPKGAETRVARLLGIKRAAVVGFPDTTPGLSKLISLAQRLVHPLTKPHVGRSSQPGETKLDLIPTHIKHYKSSAPVDMRKAKADKALRRKAGRKNKSQQVVEK